MRRSIYIFVILNLISIPIMIGGVGIGFGGDSESDDGALPTISNIASSTSHTISPCDLAEQFGSSPILDGIGDIQDAAAYLYDEEPPADCEE